MDPLTLASLINGGYNLVTDAIYNSEAPVSTDHTLDVAVRGNPEDRHLINQLSDFIATGGGLWGTSTKERNFEQGMKYLDSFQQDYSQVNNRNNLLNIINPNTMSAPTVSTAGNDWTQQVSATMLNQKSNKITAQNYEKAYDQSSNIDKKEKRQAMMNYFALGGNLEGLNGVTEFDYEVGKEYNVDENTYNKLLQLGYKIQVL